MRWSRAIALWLLIVLAESIHGTLRQLFLVPLLGVLPSRQWGVLTACVLIFLIAWLGSRWLGAVTFAEQIQVGALWVVLMLAFEFSLGAALGYPPARLLGDYNPATGGFMVFGMLFLLFAPALAARVRGVTAPANSPDAE